MLVNYTWAKATDTGQILGNGGTFYGGNTILDPNNVRGENGLSDMDVRHRFVGSFVYNPRLFESNKWGKTIVDGFTFAGTFTGSAGTPIAAIMGGASVYSGAKGSYGAQGGIYGGAMSSSSGAATNGRPPQIGRNSIVGPGYSNFDLRISRDIPIHEGIKLQFSADAYNLVNRRIVTGVNSTYSVYSAATLNADGTYSCNGKPQTPGPAGTLQGCIAPAATGASGFGTPSATSSNLYGPRQMQFIAKFLF